MLKQTVKRVDLYVSFMEWFSLDELKKRMYFSKL